MLYVVLIAYNIEFTYKFDFVQRQKTATIEQKQYTNERMKKIKTMADSLLGLYWHKNAKAFATFGQFMYIVLNSMQQQQNTNILKKKTVTKMFLFLTN